MAPQGTQTMYEINFATCTLEDVIERSATCHPGLFADTLREQARTHISAYSSIAAYDRHAGNVAANMASDCNTMAERLASDGDIGELTFGQRIIAFGIAARLQCVPHAAQRDIARRDDEARTAA
jgi:aminoglycoside N3'-acetyltransferase